LQETVDAPVTPGGPAAEPPDVAERVSPPTVPTSDDLRSLDALDDPRLVLSDGYVGLDRRRPGLRRALSRITFISRRMLLRLDVLVVLAVLVVVAGGTLVVTTLPRLAPHAAAALPADPLDALPKSDPVTPTVPSTVPSSVPAAAPTTPVPTGASTPATTAAPAAAAAPAPPAAPAAVPLPDPSSPQAMGATALALVRYPWQQVPGYSIQFLSIADAPSAGFYGNTNFTWGQTGGVSTLYVYPGETVQQLAGITAFEIGHEVDAAYVEPQGGHEQIAAILGVHPASWAPECDCAEQGYLSGWYAAAFSNYWSPGVGAWSSLAPPPSGAILAAVQPWLDPRVP
ncbi:MAG TPA: hypothetical protein VF279_07870, partial [Acidimicrobiales bacterium]